MLMRRGPTSANQQSAGSLVDVHPWAIALSGDGQYLAGVTENGRVGVWDLGEGGTQIRDHETKGSFGTCIDLVGFLSHREALASTNIPSPPMAASLPVVMKMVLSTSSSPILAACRFPYQVRPLLSLE